MSNALGRSSNCVRITSFLTTRVAMRQQLHTRTGTLLFLGATTVPATTVQLLAAEGNLSTRVIFVSTLKGLNTLRKT